MSNKDNSKQKGTNANLARNIAMKGKGQKPPKQLPKRSSQRGQ